MRKHYDFSKAKRVTPDRVIKNPSIMISLRVPGHVVARLRDEADRMGMPYQTLINTILHRFANGELIDKNEAKKIAG